MPTDSLPLKLSPKGTQLSAHGSLVRIGSLARPSRQGCLEKVPVGNIVVAVV